MEYVWNGMEWYGMIMESTWSVPYGFHIPFHGIHMEWCINYDKITVWLWIVCPIPWIPCIPCSPCIPWNPYGMLLWWNNSLTIYLVHYSMDSMDSIWNATMIKSRHWLWVLYKFVLTLIRTITYHQSHFSAIVQSLLYEICFNSDKNYISSSSSSSSSLSSSFFFFSSFSLILSSTCLVW